MYLPVTKYHTWYNNIIVHARSRSASDYTETHHIIPKSFFAASSPTGWLLGSPDTESNLVELTFREHFLCHWLLTKMTHGKAQMKMLFALSCMRRVGRYHNRMVCSWQYATARRAHLAARHAQGGTAHTPEAKKKISESRKGKPKSPAHKEKLRIARSKQPGTPHTTETKQRLSERNKAKKWWNNGTEQRYCDISPGPEWNLGMITRTSAEKALKLSASRAGKIYWTNGIDQRMSIDSPGDGWVQGRIYYKGQLTKFGKRLLDQRSSPEEKI